MTHIILCQDLDQSSFLGLFLAVTVLFVKLGYGLFLQSQKALNNYLNDPFDICNNGREGENIWKSDFFILLLSELYNPERQQRNGVH